VADSHQWHDIWPGCIHHGCGFFNGFKEGFKLLSTMALIERGNVSAGRGSESVISTSHCHARERERERKRKDLIEYADVYGRKSMDALHLMLSGFSQDLRLSERDQVSGLFFQLLLFKLPDNYVSKRRNCSIAGVSSGVNELARI